MQFPIAKTSGRMLAASKRVLTIIALLILGGVNVFAETPASSSSQFVVPTTPDPLAISMLYEVYFAYDGDRDAIEAYATKTNMDAFAKCMIEHRGADKIRPNELWEFVTHAAAIVRTKNMASRYWPPAARGRSAGLVADYQFNLFMKQVGYMDLTKEPVNALAPHILRSNGLTYAGARALILQMGLSSPDVCAKTPVAKRGGRQSSDDDQ